MMIKLVNPFYVVGSASLSIRSCTSHQGLFNMWFQLRITIGILVVNLLNYFVAKIEGG